MPPKANPTHFLCIPLAGGSLRRSLAEFKADVTSITSFAVPQDAVRPPGTLHLTLGVMSLAQPSQLDRAIRLLQQMKLQDVLSSARAAVATRVPTSSSGGPLAVDLRGLHTMQIPSKTTVLYAPPSDPEGGVLYEFCKSLKRPFVEDGLMVEDARPLLLHATVVNTIYVKRSGGNASAGGSGRRRGASGKSERLTVDATQILSRYEDYEWATGLVLDKVAICLMGAKQIEGTDDARYVPVVEVPI